MNGAVWFGAAVATLYAVVCVCAGALACRALGRRVPPSGPGPEWTVLRFGLGHLLLGSLWTVVALLGAFELRIVLGVCLSLSLASGLVFAGSVGAQVGGAVERSGGRPSTRALLIAAGAALLLMRSMYPPVNDDALRAYLLTPRVVAETQTLAFQPFNTFVVWPLLTEMNTAATLLLANETAATVFDAWVALALLAALVALSRRAGLGGFGTGVAVLAMVSTSAFLNLLGASKVDIAGSMHGVLAACFALAGGGLPAAPGLAGLFLGAAMAVKYSNLLLVPGIVALLWWSGPGRSIRVLLIAGSAAALSLAPQLVKNTWLVGNPVAPFLGKMFGTADTYWAISLAGDIGGPADFSWVHRLIWPLVLTFGGHTGMLGLVSPLLLALLPLTLRLGLPEPGQRALAWSAAAVLGAWFLVSPWGLLFPRFLFMPIALLGVVVGGVAEAARRVPGLRPALGAGLVLSLLLTLLDLRSVRYSARYALGGMSRAEVYERHESARHWYALARTLNEEASLKDRAYLEMPYQYFLRLDLVIGSQRAEERQRALRSCAERDQVVKEGGFRWLVQPTEEFRWLVSLVPGCPLPPGFEIVERSPVSVLAVAAP